MNDWGVLSDNGPQALAMNSQADCASFYNCKFRSFQDTWMTANNDVSRHYVKDCWIEGAVDYFMVVVMCCWKTVRFIMYGVEQ